MKIRLIDKESKHLKDMEVSSDIQECAVLHKDDTYFTFVGTYNNIPTFREGKVFFTDGAPEIPYLVVITKSECQIVLDAMDIAYADDDAPIFDNNPNAETILKSLDKRFRDIVEGNFSG